jgi:membrane-bound lytic murein transglycosylase D
MIESGLVPTARSWASAVGLWQFIRATGAVYGLEVNWWVDERRDPVKSTRAAAQHLRDLHDIWGDWYLSLANYNLSPRGLRRAIRAAGGVEDYWAAYPYLPRETRGYVPGYIAATMIAMNPDEFGFDTESDVTPYNFDVVEVDGLMPLEELAKAAGVTLQEIKDYNPELLRWATPPGGKYPLKIPTGIKEQFLAAYQEIPQNTRASEVAMHTVSSGETLGYIARRYGTSVRALYETNEGLSSTIHPGQRIVVPVAPGSQEQIASNRPTNSSSSSSSRSSRQQVQAPANTSPATYTVKSGDTVGHVAEWFDVRAWQVRSWNGVGNTIRVGQRLTIHVPNQRRDYFNQIDDLTYAQKQELERRQRAGENIYSIRFEGSSTTPSDTFRYTVRRNDTLGSIARRHGVSVAEIQRANNLSGTTIYAGQSLIIKR